MRSKWTSRKFLMAIAAFMGSLGTSIIGVFQNNPSAVVIGNICMMLSAGIYAAMEAIVDAAAVDKGAKIVEEEEADDDN